MSNGASWIAEMGRNKRGTRKFKKRVQRRIMRREKRKVIEYALFDEYEYRLKEFEMMMPIFEEFEREKIDEYERDYLAYDDERDYIEYDDGYFEHSCPVCGRIH
jgi:hypothetical protein